MNLSTAKVTDFLTHHLIVSCFFTFAALSAMHEALAEDSSRVADGLVALYTFESGSGDLIRDRSGNGEPLDLRIERSQNMQWIESGIRVKSSVAIRSSSPAMKITRAIRRSNALTIEAWIQPAREIQSGPARIVSISADPNQRNVTLSQDGNRYDVRLRTTKTSSNGIPSTATPNQLKTALTHVVYARLKDGTTRIFIDGRETVAKESYRRDQTLGQ